MFSLWYSIGLLSVFSKDGVFILNLSLKQMQARASSELVEIVVNAHGESNPELQIILLSNIQEANPREVRILYRTRLCRNKDKAFHGSPSLASQFLFLCLPKWNISF